MLKEVINHLSSFRNGSVIVIFIGRRTFGHPWALHNTSRLTNKVFFAYHTKVYIFEDKFSELIPFYAKIFFDIYFCGGCIVLFYGKKYGKILFEKWFIYLCGGCTRVCEQ